MPQVFILSKNSNTFNFNEIQFKDKEKEMFSLLRCASGAISKKSFPNVRPQRPQKKILYIFYSFIVLSAIHSIIHFESIVYDMKYEPKPIDLAFGLE